MSIQRTSVRIASLALTFTSNSAFSASRKGIVDLDVTQRGFLAEEHGVVQAGTGEGDDLPPLSK
ncbi:MAG: hypothetical protein R3D61_00770 [Defluviimonas denitrificans]